MEKSKLQQMRASEIHRIIAAVMEIMEKAKFEPKVNAELQEVKDTDHWKMMFAKQNTSLDELTSIKNELGKNFGITIRPKDKENVFISVEAPVQDFMSLLQRKLGNGIQQTIFDDNKEE